MHSDTRNYIRPRPISLQPLLFIVIQKNSVYDAVYNLYRLAALYRSLRRLCSLDGLMMRWEDVQNSFGTIRRSKADERTARQKALLLTLQLPNPSSIATSSNNAKSFYRHTWHSLKPAELVKQFLVPKMYHSIIFWTRIHLHLQDECGMPTEKPE
jgi:hypothetical protein